MTVVAAILGLVLILYHDAVGSESMHGFARNSRSHVFGVDSSGVMEQVDGPMYG
jgi:hypothetical protein